MTGGLLSERVRRKREKRIKTNANFALGACMECLQGLFIWVEFQLCGELFLATVLDTTAIKNGGGCKKIRALFRQCQRQNPRQS